MNKMLLLLSMGIFLLPPISFSQDKSFKEQLADLKKSFHPDKAFIMPFTDTSNEDLQAFLYSVKLVKGVKGATVKLQDGKAVVSVDTKTAMVTVWNNIDKEMRNRYTVTDRTPNGFVLADSYQSAALPAAPVAAAPKEVAGATAVKPAQKADSIRKRKTMLERQQDYAEQMRQRDQNMEKGRMDYDNPKDYNTKASAAKGTDYIEYKINGKPYAIYNTSTNYVSMVTSRADDKQEYSFRDISHNKQFYIKFVNPAMWPDIRKYEFGKEGIKTRRVGSYDVTPNSDLFFLLQLRIDGPTISNNYNASGYIGAKPGPNDNIVSGSFEVVYFEPGIGGIADIKFNLVLKGGKSRNGQPQPDIVITDGRMRAIMRN